MNKRKKIVYSLLTILLLYLFLEVCCRFYVAKLFNVSFFTPAEFYYKLYPELKEADLSFPEDTSGLQVLVLGGSAVTEDYCPLAAFYSIQNNAKNYMFNSARVGQTSMDSWYKFQYLKKYPWDIVIFYHGINDTRANNIPPEYFDDQYRHFDFYNLVYILRVHPYMNVSVVPFLIHWVYDQLSKDGFVAPPPYYRLDSGQFHIMIDPNEDKLHPHVPPYYRIVDGKLLDGEDKYWHFASDVKSAAVFKRNLTSIIHDANANGAQVIVSTYAYYNVPNYSLQAFTNKELDYSKQLWPTEIYGLPENVVKGIEAHNSVVLSLKPNSKLKVVNFNATAIKSKLYFDDICHLTETGCEGLSNLIWDN